jgi:hypothetical protein
MVVASFFPPARKAGFVIVYRPHADASGEIPEENMIQRHLRDSFARNGHLFSPASSHFSSENQRSIAVNNDLVF